MNGLSRLICFQIRLARERPPPKRRRKRLGTSVNAQRRGQTLDPGNTQRAENLLPELSFARELWGELADSYTQFEKPWKKLLLSTIALLIGFFLSEFTQDGKHRPPPLFIPCIHKSHTIHRFLMLLHASSRSLWAIRILGVHLKLGLSDPL